jgi:hypothetical protein
MYSYAAAAIMIKIVMTKKDYIMMMIMRAERVDN